MKQIFDKFSSWMNAVTFAEAGEFETARQMMPEAQKGTAMLTQFDKLFTAVTFAEAGLHEEAIDMLKVTAPENSGQADFLETIGLKGIRITYGTMSIEAIA